jgi:hypothetical protein
MKMFSKLIALPLLLLAGVVFVGCTETTTTGTGETQTSNSTVPEGELQLVSLKVPNMT